MTDDQEYKKREYHRKWMAAWRKQNREKSREITRKSYIKYADKYNERRRNKLKTDPEFRKKKIESEKKYKATGRRKEFRIRDAKKLRAKSTEWKKKNPQRVKKYIRQYRDKVWIAHERELRKNLDDKYVLRVVKKSMNYIVKSPDVPKELIEIQRTKIFTERKLKQII